MIKTRGDQYLVECPSCGQMIRDLWYLGNELYAGNHINCPHCGKEVMIEEAEMTVHIVLGLEKPDNPTESM